MTEKNFLALPRWWRDGRLLASFFFLTGWLGWAFWRLAPRGHLLMAPRALPHYHRWAYRRLAYSDIVALYHTHHLYLHLIPYIQNRIEYPVVMGILMWLTSFAPGIMGYFTANAVIIWLSGMGSLVLLRRLVPNTYQWFAWTPLLLVYGLLNWDIVGIFLMILGWDLYVRQRYAWAAGMFSVAVFFKFFPVFILPFILVELYRDKKFQIITNMVAVFFVVSLIINLPFALTNFNNWSFFYSFNASRGVGADLWANHWVHALPVAVVDVASFVVVCATVVWQSQRVWKGHTVISATARLFAVFLIVNKVFSPQYMIWMMAFAILAEWPTPAYTWLTFGGIVDYLNSMTVLYLIKIHSSTLRWYGDRLFPLGLLMRYLGLAIAGLLGSRQSLPQTVTGSANPPTNAAG